MYSQTYNDESAKGRCRTPKDLQVSTGVETLVRAVQKAGLALTAM